MRWKMTLVWLVVGTVVAVAVALSVAVRMLPNDLARFHLRPEVAANKDFSGGVKRRQASGPKGLARLHAVALRTPRTVVLAGSVQQGHVTYITRTRFIGFPDYTSVVQQGDDLLIYGRLRFGRRDFGVNKARVDGWLSAISE